MTFNPSAFSVAPPHIKDEPPKTELDYNPAAFGKAYSKPAEPEGLITAWSPSSLKKYEQCPYAAFLQYVKRIRLPSGKAAERGTVMHSEAEAYIKGEGEMTKSLEKFEHRFNELRERYSEQKVIVEQEWGFDQEWKPVSWRDPKCWARMKLDSFEIESETSGVIDDWKSGKKDGNEISHSGQGMIYAIGAFMLYPTLEYLRVFFRYLDEGKQLEKVYRRHELPIFQPRVTARAMRMTTATTFDPKPSKHNCQFCGYYDSGDCEYGIRE